MTLKLGCRVVWVLLIAARSVVQANPTRVLFIGNSFTFVNDLPHQLINVARSLNVDVQVANSTIGGCTLYHQTPSRDRRTAILMREHWDYIVLQDYSAMATVELARTVYMQPAVSEFAQAIAHSATKIVLYLTWGYHDGNRFEACPSSDTAACFPLGSLASLTRPPCETSSHYHNLTETFECMGYAVARGYLAMRSAVPGVAMVAPCGLAWQIVRGSTRIPTACKTGIDAQYAAPLNLSLPFQVPNATLPNFELYRVYTGKKGFIDKHPNTAGQYLNALVMFTTLFGRSAVGAAPPLPTGSPAAGDLPLTAEEMVALQTAADGAVRACGSDCGAADAVEASASSQKSSLPQVEW